MPTNTNTLAKMRNNTWNGNANDMGRAGINADGNFYVEQNTPGAVLDVKTGDYIIGKACPNGATGTNLGVVFQDAADKVKGDSDKVVVEKPVAKESKKSSDKKKEEEPVVEENEELDLVEGDEV